MKLFYLIRKTYSQYFIREFVIISMTVYMMYALTIITNPFLSSIATYNQMQESIISSAIYYQPYDRIANHLQGFTGVSNEEIEHMYHELEEELELHPNFIGQGEAANYYTSDVLGNESNYTNVILYNEVLREQTQPTLDDGQWFAQCNEELDYIPIVVGGSYRESCIVGDVLNICLDMTGTGETRECVVIGILDELNMVYNLSHGATKPELDSLISISDAQEGIVIAPAEEATLFTQSISVGKLLFFDKSASLEEIVNDLETNNNMGYFVDIEEMYYNQLQTLLLVYNVEFVMLCILLLFGLFGLGGYTLLSNLRNEQIFGIYYLCGMRKWQMILINILAASTLVILPSVITNILLAYWVERTTKFTAGELSISIIIVALIISMSIIISLLRGTRMNFTKLMRGE